MVAAIGAKNCLSRNLASFEHCFPQEKEENTGIQLYRTLDIQETLWVVSFLVFLPENISQVCFMHPHTPHDIITIKMMLPAGSAHSQLYCFKV